MTTYRLLLASCLLFGAACAEEEAVPIAQVRGRRRRRAA